MKHISEYKLPIVAGIIYIAGMITIALSLRTASVLLFMAESACLLWMCLELNASKNKEETVGETDELTEKNLLLEQEKIELNQRIEALEKEVEEKTLDIKRIEMQALADSKNLKEKYEELAKATGRNESEIFLPPIEEDEKENDTLDIIKIANETIDELTPFAKKVGINIIVSTSDESLLVRGNISRMRIMFRNIIDNSIKYMNRSGNLIITISNIGEDIFIVLKDNGNGLSEDETKHIFELNFQGSNRISGNGLGLTQAKAIVDYYGGTIYAKSNIGRGMGIYIQLPTT